MDETQDLQNERAWDAIQAVFGYPSEQKVALQQADWVCRGVADLNLLQ